MNIYTAKGKAVDAKVQEKLDIVIDEIKKNIPDALSVIIYGGFGRGEGSVRLEKDDAVPANDFDMYVITQKKTADEILDGIAERSAKRMGRRGIDFHSFSKEQTFKDNFYVDLKCLTTDELKKLFPMIRYYELKYATNLLYGEDTRNLIPNYKATDIPLAEGARILLNRLTHLAEYLSTEGKHDDEVLAFFCSKAYIDSATALLLLNRKYVPSYKGRAQVFYDCYEKDFADLAKKLPDLHKKVKKYTDWKINFDGSLPEKDITKFWMNARNDALEVAKYFFSKYLHKNITTIDELHMAIRTMGKTYYKPYAYYYLKYRIGWTPNFLQNILVTLLPYNFKWKYHQRLKEQHKKYSRTLHAAYGTDVMVFSVVPYVLMALNNDFSLNKEYFSKAKECLAEIYPTNATTWEQLSQDYADAYVLFFLLKIV